MAGPRREDGNTTAALLGVVAAVITLIAALLTLVPALRTWPPGGDVEQPSGSRTASVFLNRDNGPGDTEVKASGEGFAAGERVTFRFHTEQIGQTTANGDGKFSNVALTIPTSFSQFAPQQFDVLAQGAKSIRTARTPFQLTG